MWYQNLPHVNAILNAASALLLVSGYAAIRRRNERLHARLMTRALVCSAAFLASYLTYHYLAGHRAYPGTGSLRIVYLVVLFSHIGLAILTVPLALTTYGLARSGRIERHRRLARITLPIWLYVSITGVIVYLMLYIFTPRSG